MGQVSNLSAVRYSPQTLPAGTVDSGQWAAGRYINACRGGPVYFRPYNTGSLRGDLRFVRDIPAETGEVLKNGVLEGGLGDVGRTYSIPPLFYYKSKSVQKGFIKICTIF